MLKPLPSFRLVHVLAWLCTLSLSCQAQTSSSTVTSTVEGVPSKIQLEFAGEIRVPSCSIQFSSENKQVFTVALPGLDSDFFLNSAYGPVTPFSIDLLVAEEPKANQTQPVVVCDPSVAAAIELLFDIGEMSLSENGSLKNTLKDGPSANVLVEVVRFTDDLSAFEPLNLRTSPSLTLRSNPTQTQAKVNLGLRYVKDAQAGPEVQAGGFTAYMPFLLKYD